MPSTDESKRGKTQLEQTVTLSNGVVMPLVGLGTWKSPVGKTGNAVKVAVKNGYRMIDTANDYANEHEIGEALKELFAEGVVKREELFIQSKLWNSNHRKAHVKGDLVATLEDLQLDYVDSFVIHWPQACPANNVLATRKTGACTAPKSWDTMFPLEDDGTYASDNECHFLETWEAMEDLVDEGLCKSIGLSNFNKAQIEEILAHVRKHKPVVLQNECHPYLQQKDLIDFCKINGILFQAYSPLGSADRPWAKPGDKELLDDPALQEIAKAHGKTTAQLVLRWNLQRGVSVVPKSVTPERIISNFGVFDFELSDEEMKRFDQFNRNWRHLIWPACGMHPDFPFKDELPHDFKVPKALDTNPELRKDLKKNVAEHS